MHELTPADLIWNRATMAGEGPSLRSGDLALRRLLRAHGLVMNGGVLHAINVLTPGEFAEAQSGYQYFGFPRVATLLAHAKTFLDAGDEIELEIQEIRLDREYHENVPDDTSLLTRFRERFALEPGEFSPLQ